MELLIGNKNYSSWSLRGWWMLKAFKLPFKEIQLSLFTPEFYTAIAKCSPASKVPVLIDGDITVWDSLAICEYVSETYLQDKGWPENPAHRATARAVSCQMHAEFSALRQELPMNCKAKRRVTLSPAAQKDVASIEQLWSHLRAQHSDKGPWLFGALSIADIMYAPVALRFITYGINLNPVAQTYLETLYQQPDIQAWIAAAQLETDVVEEDEAGEPV